MKEKICPITVAQAPPAIPQSQTKIKMGSRMVLIIAPTTMQTIEYFGFPSARIKLLIPFVTMRNGIPINVILAYCFAYGNTSVVAPNAFRSKGRKVSPTSK